MAGGGVGGAALIAGVVCCTREEVEAEEEEARRRQRALESGRLEPWSKKPRNGNWARIPDEEWVANLSEC